MSIRLHINIDHIATVRNARGTRYPDPVAAAFLCESAGADGITVHLREDRRHIRDEDVLRLRESVGTFLNLEMAATSEMMAIAQRVRPHAITLVPERREEQTTEGGLDVRGQRDAIRKIVQMAKQNGIKTSLFINADPSSVEESAELGVQQVELHTGEYCHAYERNEHVSKELERIVMAAAKAFSLGLDVAAGHGLHRHNVGAIASISEVSEVNIGHSVIADAVFWGLERAVKELRLALDRHRR